VIASGQHRLARVQLVNWGTFHGYFDLPVPRAGLLVTGPSGSGKSSMLDALATVLVQPRWIQFNAAAQEGGAGDRSRSLVSYVRGAYKREADESSGEVATSYLRASATWSAVALTFDDAEGGVTTALRLFYLPRGTNASGDLTTLFCLAETPVDVMALAPFAENGIDQRRLKAAHATWLVQSSYSAFAVRLQRRLGLASDQAQRLLHKTQSAKNLTSLDTLLREFMLDEPDTFDLVKSATEQFEELSAAHSSVVDARRQVEALGPMRPIAQERQRWTDARAELAEEREHLESVRLTRHVVRAASEVAQFDTHLSRLAVEIARADEAEQARRDDRDAERAAVDGRGGRELELVEREADNQRARSESVAQARRRAEAKASAVGLRLPDDEQGWPGFLDAVGRASAALVEDGEAREARHRLSGAHSEARRRVENLDADLRALANQRSGLEPALLALRDDLMAATGAPPGRLAFGGELIAVRPEANAWTGAIERVLRPLARTLLVPEDLYPHVSGYVDDRHLGLRLVYARVPARPEPADAPSDGRSLVHKVTVAESPHAAWLAAELAQRFDYACVDSVAELRSVGRGVTLAGQVKHTASRHEKDDRSGVDDRRFWVLGSSREAKRVALEEALATARQQEAAALCERDAAESERDGRREQALALASLGDVSWADVDARGTRDRLGDLERRAAELGRATGLAVARALLERAEAALREAGGVARQLRDKHVRVGADRERTAAHGVRCEVQLAEREPVPDAVASRLDARFGEPAASGVDDAARTVHDELAQAVQTADRRLGNAASRAERLMSGYKNGWPAESADLAVQVDFLPDYLAILDRLEADRLPDFENRFFDLLQGQSRNNIGMLAQRLNNSRREVRARVDPINTSLRRTEYAPGRYLHVRVDDRRLPEVTTFLKDLAEITSGSLEDALGSQLDDQARGRSEQRFLRMRDLLRRMSSAAPEDVRWRSLCLDTRLHVQFIAEVRGEDGRALDYFVGAGGLSGGERQKLVTFCLAAALRYQLAREGADQPTYGLVVLDEAFDKTDPAFTRAGLDVFRSFGFQLLLATPLKMLQTLEDYVGGAAVVLNESGRASRFEVLRFDEADAAAALAEVAAEASGQESLL
jgi:uncharacterized protein YPO0396